MNRDQKATAIAEIAADIDSSHAIFAVDYRGISVPQAAELRSKLREADATFKVVKNSLTERAADQVGAETLKTLLAGPTALTFVRGDVATAAKAIADYARSTQLLPFKGGLMDGAALDPDQIRSISRLPSREVLYGQLVGVVASPVSGLVRTLSALIGGLASALGQVREQKESGELPAGDPPAVEASTVVEEAPAAEETAAATEEPAAKEAPAASAEPEATEETPTSQAPEETAGEAAPEDKAEPENRAEPESENRAEPEPENRAEPEPENQAEPESENQAEPAQETDDNPKADAAAEDQSEDAEANPTKED
jgi:large subunit ribosomal protein L10